MDRHPPRPRQRSRRSATRRLALAALALVLVAVGVGPAGSPPAGASADSATPVDGAFQLTGRGWGHGRGMSQWGAQGAAAQGHSHQEILGFYYPGSSLDTVPRGTVRVKVTGEDSDLKADSSPALTVTDLATGVRVRGSSLGSRVRVARASDGYLRIQRRSNGRWVSVSHASWSRQRVRGPVVLSGPSTLWLTMPNGTEREYRGTLTVHRHRGTIDVVNTVDLEHYLYGVVPRESPSWFGAAALRAQAIAARSYAWSNCSAGAGHYDLRDTTACQVYEGKTRRSGGRTVSIETPQTRVAVDATRHQVLRRGGAVLRTEFSSSNGGWTVASNGWPARRDSWDGVDSRNTNHQWQASVSTAKVARAWPQVGTPRRLEVVARTGGGDWGGRVAQLRVTGSRGSVVVTGSRARFALGLKSDWFALAGARSGTGSPAPSGPPAAQPLDFPVGEVAVVDGGPPTAMTRVASEHGEPLAYEAAVTALRSADPDAWRFFLWGEGGSEPPDLVGVKYRGTGSGRVEVHVLSGESGYTRFTRHSPTPLRARSPGDESWQFVVASHRGSGNPDLYAIRLRGAGTGRTEVHVLSAASRWKTWVRHSVTALGPTDPARTTFVVGDDRQRGDVMAVVHGAPTGSGRTEVHRLSEAANYKRFNLHAATALHTTRPGEFRFAYGDYDQDGSLDLYATRVAGSGVDHVRLHVLSDARSFTTWREHKVTGVPADPDLAVAVRQW